MNCLTNLKSKSYVILLAFVFSACNLPDPVYIEYYSKNNTIRVSNNNWRLYEVHINNGTESTSCNLKIDTLYEFDLDTLKHLDKCFLVNNANLFFYATSIDQKTSYRAMFYIKYMDNIGRNDSIGPIKIKGSFW